MKKLYKSEILTLHQLAEESLTKKSAKPTSVYSDDEILKLYLELEEHQIELEMQNEELILAKEEADVVNHKYIELYDFAPSGYFTLSKKSEIIELNLYGATLLGKERQLLKNNRFDIFVSKDTKPIFTLFLSKVFKSKTQVSCEITLSTDGNSPMYVYLNGIVTENSEKCNVNLMNITDRKRAEELTLANKELAFQNREKEKRADELIVANKELAFQNEEKEKRAAELFIANKELAFQNREKEKRAAELIIANKELEFQNEEKEKRAAELIFANKELEQVLQLNSDKDLFISILAHDLKSPFNALLGLSELLEDNIQEYNIDKIRDISGDINKSAQTAYNFLEDLLMWARAESGKIPFEPQKLCIRDICMDILEIHKLKSDAKNITINYYTTDHINVLADIDMLKTVLRNLVSNAIKFTNNGGQIDIYVEKNHTEVTITISDNGIGINPDNLTKLFDISQIQTTTGTAKEKGTGLGLVLCKEFIEKHGGKIWVESEYGKGSEFKFTMPVFTEQHAKDINN
jgi:signal transduction histidine kinase